MKHETDPSGESDSVTNRIKSKSLSNTKDGKVHTDLRDSFFFGVNIKTDKLIILFWQTSEIEGVSCHLTVIMTGLERNQSELDAQ